MLTFFVLFLLFIVLFTLSIRTGLSFMGRFSGGHVRRHHEAAEYIINTGRVPDEWQCATGGWWRMSGAPNALSRTQAVARLSRLIAYFEKSSLVDGESTRKLLVDELERVRQRWQQDR